jgi:hypothetical protein
MREPLKVRSRILVGAGAWLLGAAAATGGSLYAVHQLGQGLLDQRTKQVTAAMVNAELTRENSERGSASPRSSPRASARSSPSRRSKSPSPSPSASTSADAGQLLTAPDGTAVAVCQNGNARLVYWSPQQGYEVARVVRGPAPVATVIFRGSGGGEVMKVSCDGTQPVEHVSPLQGDDGSGPDD